MTTPIGEEEGKVELTNPEERKWKKSNHGNRPALLLVNIVHISANKLPKVLFFSAFSRKWHSAHSIYVYFWKVKEALLGILT